jgi:hypothetical protein
VTGVLGEMIDRSSVAVLMTATINPAAASICLHRSDPQQRLQDYSSGLKFWLDFPDDRITSVVFCEKSGHDLSDFAEIVERCASTKSVELISTNDNIVPKGLHYGYAEARIIEHALENSSRLAAARYFIKATGRLTFPNVSRLLDRLGDDTLFAVDCRGSRGFIRKREPFVRTELMLFASDFYRRYLMGASAAMAEKGVSHIENHLYAELMKWYGHRGAVLRWTVNVDPRGHAAHWNKQYGSIDDRMKSAIRAITRVVCPNWWI